MRLFEHWQALSLQSLGLGRMSWPLLTPTPTTTKQVFCLDLWTALFPTVGVFLFVPFFPSLVEELTGFGKTAQKLKCPRKGATPVSYFWRHSWPTHIWDWIHTVFTKCSLLHSLVCSFTHSFSGLRDLYWPPPLSQPGIQKCGLCAQRASGKSGRVLLYTGQN